MRPASASLVIACLLLSAAPACATAVEGDLDALIGVKTLRSRDWEPLDTQAEFGVQAAIRPDDWPVALAINALSSDAVERTRDTPHGTRYREGSTSALQLGAMWILDLPGSTRPFIAGGLTLAYAAFSTDDDASSSYTSGGGAGWWADGGVIWTIGHFNIGPHVGFSAVRARLDDRTVEAGGLHVGLLLGGHW